MASTHFKRPDNRTACAVIHIVSRQLRGGGGRTYTLMGSKQGPYSTAFQFLNFNGPRDVGSTLAVYDYTSEFVHC